MKITYRKQFIKQFKRLQRREQLAVDDAIDRFEKNPVDPSLYNHPLKGNMKGKRALSAGFDLRIIFKEYDGYAVVIMLDVGSHENVYG